VRKLIDADAADAERRRRRNAKKRAKRAEKALAEGRVPGQRGRRAKGTESGSSGEADGAAERLLTKEVVAHHAENFALAQAETLGHDVEVYRRDCIDELNACRFQGTNRFEWNAEDIESAALELALVMSLEEARPEAEASSGDPGPSEDMEARSGDPGPSDDVGDAAGEVEARELELAIEMSLREAEAREVQGPRSSTAPRRARADDDEHPSGGRVPRAPGESSQRKERRAGKATARASLVERVADASDDEIHTVDHFLANHG
jgi:hypothetical protein